MEEISNYRFKVTTQGRKLLAGLLATGKCLEITRVAVGSGRVSADEDLANRTELVKYVAEGTIAERRHHDNVLELTVQYASNFTPGLGAFYLAEFLIAARDPESGEEVTIVYATLGDYVQPVNAYSDTLPPDVRNYPLSIVISDEIEVTITAPAGLVTYDDLQAAVDKSCSELVESMATGGIKKSIPYVIAAADWLEADPPVNGKGFYYDLADTEITAAQIPLVSITDATGETAKLACVGIPCTAYNGYVRFRSKRRPTAEIAGTCHLLVRGSVGGNVGEIPVATADTLGGVKVQGGSGLKIDPEGNLSVDTATNEETAGAIDEAFEDGGQTV